MQNAVVEIRSSYRATGGSHVSNCIWFLVSAGLLFILNSYGEDVMGHYWNNEEAATYRHFEKEPELGELIRLNEMNMEKVHSYREYWSLDLGRQSEGERVLMALLGLGLFIFSFLIIACVFDELNLLYSVRNVTRVDKGAGIINSKIYRFPYSHQEIEKRFYQIVSMTVKQGSVDSIFNAGSIRLTLVFHSSNGYIQEEFVIYCVENPSAVAEQIREGLPEYEGQQVLVKMK